MSAWDSAQPLPERIEELTPEWLTAALRAEGVLKGARVTAREIESLDGVGLIATVARLRLTYDRAESAAPATVIAKLPTPAEKNRAIGISGDYEREVRFYQELAAQLPVRCPRPYAALFEGEPGRGANRKLSRNADQRFVLLLEDMAPAPIGDDMAGCDAGTAARVLEAAARMHAAYWEHPALDEHWWLWRVGAHSEAMHEAYLAGRPAFDAYYRERLPAWLFDRLDWLDEHGNDLNERLCEAPRTFLHVDFRLDNLFFPDVADIVFFDWQTPGVGPAVYDVASFLGNSLRVEAEPAAVDSLLRRYHAALMEHDVTGYAFDELSQHYAMQLLLSLRGAVINFTYVDWADDRAIARRDMHLQRKVARLNAIDSEAVARFDR